MLRALNLFFAPDPPACEPRKNRFIAALLVTFLLGVTSASAIVLWSDSDAILVHENGSGSDILGGAVKRDADANDTLYFKFHVEPLSDVTDEPEYFAALELYESGVER